MDDTLKTAEAVRHALKTAHQTVKRLIGENEELHTKVGRLTTVLQAVQTDRGNWLHRDLNYRIAEIVGPPGDYRALDRSGVGQVSQGASAT